MRLGSFSNLELLKVAATAATAPDIRVVAGNLLACANWLLENAPGGRPPSRKSRAAMARTKIAHLGRDVAWKSAPMSTRLQNDFVQIDSVVISRARRRSCVLVPRNLLTAI
jgi:hypothetical protein